MVNGSWLRVIFGSLLAVRDERLKKKEQPLLLHYKISKINENILQNLFARRGLLRESVREKT